MKKLIIFDADGVLWDSEPLNALAYSRALASCGYFLPQQECLKYFSGLSYKEKMKIIKELFPDFNEEQKEWVERKKHRPEILKGLSLIKDVENFLDFLPFEKCIASGAARNTLFENIERFSMQKHFLDENIFNSAQVAYGKPSPDVFLYAADNMGYEPSDCVVIEDGEHGTVAGVSAGMTVIGFTGSIAFDENREEYTKKLYDLGAKEVYSSFEDMKKSKYLK